MSQSVFTFTTFSVNIRLNPREDRNSLNRAPGASALPECMLSKVRIFFMASTLEIKRSPLFLTIIYTTVSTVDNILMQADQTDIL